MINSPALIRHLRTSSMALICAFAAVGPEASTPQTFDGMYVGDWEGSIFIPCKDKRGWWWLDSKDQKILLTLREASEKSFADHNRPLFIQFEGFTTNDKPFDNHDYDKTVWVARVLSIQSLDYEKSQCRIDQKPATPPK